MGGAITAVRDSVGYGFYFWSYELSKRAIADEADTHTQEALKVLLCGGLAGVVTWASIFPLDVVKTRVQTWDLVPAKGSTGVEAPLLGNAARPSKAIVTARPATWSIAKSLYHTEGASAFFRGLGVCSARAFIVNAAQWAVSVDNFFSDALLTDVILAGVRMDDESADYCVNIAQSTIMRLVHISTVCARLALKIVTSLCHLKPPSATLPQREFERSIRPHALYTQS